MQLQPLSLDDAFGASSAAALQIAIGHLLAVALGYTSSPFRAVGRWIIDLIPGPVVDVSIALLEGADKRALFWTLALLWPSSAALAGSVAGPVGAATLLALVGTVGIAATMRRPELPRMRAIIAATAAAITGPAAVLLLSPTTASIAAGSALAAAAVLDSIRRRSDLMHSAKLPLATRPLGEPPSGARFSVPGIAPLFTPTDRLYVTDVTFPTPRLHARAWHLRVMGLVARPLRLTLEELLAMESVEVDATLVCVHNPVGGLRIGTARWQGVPLSALLERVNVSREADHVLACSADGYSGGLPLSLLEHGFEPLVVYGMNGELLRRTHGAPLRLLVPGIYGYDANVKWLQTLELTRFELARDYWERKGWPRDPARVKTQSRIDVPGPAAVLAPGPQMVAGVAWSPPRGVTRVELSIDNGPWQTCELANELSPAAWRHWQFRWDPSLGHHSLRVRAWSPDSVQTEGDGAPFPRGAAGYHVVAITVSRGGARDNPFGKLTTMLRGRLHLARAGARAWRSRATHHPSAP